MLIIDSGLARGLNKVRFHDYNLAYENRDLPNIAVFREQIALFRNMLVKAAPDEAQRQDTEFLLGLGEIFTLIVYGQLILENADIYQLDDDLVDQIFDFMVRDFSKFAL
ncbi:MAG: hypothetical protein DDT19_01017 [Syntrophomonadaceae bacterium]|nr:hypothetical protein [Bacillota bacterium]